MQSLSQCVYLLCMELTCFVGLYQLSCILESGWPIETRDENGPDTAGYRVIPYPTLMYFSRIRDRIRVVKIRDGYRTGPGNNLGG